MGESKEMNCLLLVAFAVVEQNVEGDSVEGDSVEGDTVTMIYVFSSRRHPKNSTQFCTLYHNLFSTLV